MIEVKKISFEQAQIANLQAQINKQQQTINYLLKVVNGEEPAQTATTDEEEEQ